MKYSLFKNISFVAFLLVAFSACGPDNLDMTDLDKDENDPDVVICNMTVTIEESNQSPAHLTAVVEDGTPPYEYLWSTGETSEIVSITTPLPGGVDFYTVEVTDSEGCVATDTLEIGDPCFGFTCIIEEQPPGSGNLVCSVNGGSGPYAYVWSTGATSSNTTVITDGTYAVTVMDSEDCVVTGVIEVGNNNDPCLGLAMTLSEQPPGSGNLYSSVTGGTAPYSYSWSTGETTQDIVVSSNGIYQITITDDLGCTVTDEIEVNLNDPCAQFNAEIIEDPVGSGMLEAVAIAGTAPYTYSWSDGATGAITEAFFDGSYWVTITDSNGCYAIDSYEVTLGADPCQNFSVTLAEQPPGSGAIFSSVTGGTAPYTYLWSTGETTPNIQVNALGTYTLTVADAAGCVVAVFIEI